MESPGCARARRPLNVSEYLDSLWFLLHHSEDRNRRVVGLTSYLDDSGTHDGSAVVVIGGPVMSRIQFKAFCRRWKALLHKYRIPEPLHMKDFSSLGLYPEMRVAFLRAASKLINEHKLYSLSVAIPEDDFKDQLSKDVQKNLIGPYALAFMSLVLANQHLSATRHHDGKTAYLIDQGSSHPEQLLEAHALLLDRDRERKHHHTGAIAFDSDDNVPALQAADLIAWSARQRDLDRLSGDLAPLHDALQDKKGPSHAHIQIPAQGIRMFAEPINHWITTKGFMPTLRDFIR